MKNFYILIFLLFLSAASFTQTYFSEDFSDNQMPPEDWIIENLESGWGVYQDSFSGGTAPEGYFSGYATGGPNTSRLISPEIDLTGLQTVTFQFKEWIQNDVGGYSIGVATRSSGGEWNIEREITPTGIYTGPDEITLEISNEDVGASDFQICFYIDGNTEGVAWWMFDDLSLFHQINTDAGIISLNTASKVFGPTLIEGTIKNYGVSEITSIAINWQVDEGEITTTSIDGLSIPFSGTYDFSCDGFINLPPGAGYNLRVWIETVNGVTDENPDNNMAERTFDVASHSIANRPCIEGFSFSSCGPCAPFNAVLFPWIQEHNDELTYVKYPSQGDPYWNDEVEHREIYYEVYGVPWTFIDGTYAYHIMDTIQSAFNQAILDPGFVSIAGTRTTVSESNTEMDIELTLLPLVNFDEVHVYIAVFEYTTTENVGSNGETEFHHIFMKMAPDESGIVTNLTDRVPFTISETVELAGTNIEEWDDLGVIVFVQDYASRYVWQSDYIMENASFLSDAGLSDLKIDGVTIEGFSPDVFEYTVSLPRGTTEVPLIEVFASDANATAVVVPTMELPGSTTVDVFAENLLSHNTYIVNFDIATGIGTETNSVVQIYPNPASDRLAIKSSSAIEKIEIYNQAGQLVKQHNANSNLVNLNVSGLEPGMYFIKVRSPNKVSSQKLVIE